MRRGLVFLSISMLWISASAQVYRCTAANGKIEYSDEPCASTSRDSRLVAPRMERSAVEIENEQLRRQLVQEQNRRRQAEIAQIQPPAYPPPGSAAQPPFGRTEADLQAERGNSAECASAKRDYEVVSSSISNKPRIPAFEAAMYSACGMRAPDRTVINVRPPVGTCLRGAGGILHCN